MNFLYGRYGADKLNYCLLILGMVFTFCGNVFEWVSLTSLSFVAFILCIFRMMSKNIAKRQQENQKFMVYYDKIIPTIKRQYHLIVGSKTHKYFKCSNCKQVVRVPKNKGKVTITCPKCSNKFSKKT